MIKHDQYWLRHVHFGCVGSEKVLCKVGEMVLQTEFGALLENGCK